MYENANSTRRERGKIPCESGDLIVQDASSK